MGQAKALRLVFGVLGNATGLFFLLSPSVTFKRIIINKSTEQFSGIPYVMTLLNCLLATWYGLPFISPNNYLFSAINGTGVVIESVYVLIFLVYAPKKEKGKIMALLFVILAIFSTVALVSIFALKQEKKRQFFCGLAATIFSIIMYASPLSIMRMVIKTKSVEYMPFLLSLFVFLCGTLWFIYGLIGNDKFVYISNGLGCFLGAMQLILYGIYHKNKDEVEKPTIDGNLEMGLADSHQPKPPALTFQ
ncbi:bidirectional sugar transporter SWEET1-like [Salvia splendens]|uniref:bidirectional sugar transporter SWEET1-like n=1 Tax=Salvia splendens TaxID=180675 RepID=UPI001C27E27E|nr:bidirectional sugar transporter SWEET1-like [Salvia splendens]